MPRTGISYDDVKTAATALLARGEGPTIQRIREFLGTGSNSTISAHLRRWQSERSDDSPVTRLPPALPQELLPALEVFWQNAVEQAEASFIQYREQTRLELEQAEQERTAAQAQMRELQQQLEQQTQALQSSHKQLQTRAAELQDSQAKVQALQIKCAELQQATHTLQQTLENREHSLAETRSTHRVALENCRKDAREQLQAEQARYQASEQRWLQLIEQMRSEQQQREQDWVERLQKAETRWQEQQQHSRARLTQLDEALAQSRTENATLSEQARLSQKRLHATEQHSTALQAEKEQLIRNHATVQQQLEYCTQEREQLQQQLAELVQTLEAQSETDSQNGETQQNKT